MRLPITVAALALSGALVACGKGPEAPPAEVEKAAPARPTFRHLTSANGDLPVPGESKQQTASLVADLDGDGTDDLLAGNIWLTHTGDGEFQATRLADLDGDGDLDILNKPYNWEVPRVDVWLNEGGGG